MAGLVLVYDKDRRISPREAVFESLVKATCGFKNTDAPRYVWKSEYFYAAKLDKAHCTHPGLIRNESDGSWLMVMGWVVDSAAPQKSHDLTQLVQNFSENIEETLKTLEGHFALVFYNGVSQRLWLINDPFGMMPLFYTDWKGSLLVSSSALALAKVTGMPGRRDTSEMFLYTGNLYGQQTLWQGIHRLRPATLWELSSPENSMKSYWTIQPDEKMKNLPMKDGLEIMYQRGIEAMRLAFRVEKKRCCLNLTGGLDSRLLALLMSEYGMSFRCACHGKYIDPDVKVSRRLAQVMGWEYHFQEYPLDWSRLALELYSESLGLADGFLDPFTVALTSWLNKAKLIGDDLIVSGGGGEVLRGTLLSIGHPGDLDYVKNVSYEFVFKHHFFSRAEESILDTANSSTVLKTMTNHFRTVGEMFPKESAIEKLSRVYLEKMTGHNAVFIAAVLPSSRTMHPFYNRKLLSAALSVPFRLKKNSLIVRRLIEKIDSKAAGIPTDKGILCTSIDLNNFHRALIARMGFFLRRADCKWSSGIFGRVLLAVNSGFPFPFDEYLSQNPLRLSRMATGSLYRIQGLKELIQRATKKVLTDQQFFSRIIALERFFNATGTGLS